MVIEENLHCVNAFLQQIKDVDWLDFMNFHIYFKKYMELGILFYFL